MPIKIFKNVELPESGRHSGRPATYPFADMAVGDGFEIADNRGQTNSGASKAQNALGATARGFAKKHGGKFATRTLPAAMLDKTIKGPVVLCVRVA